MTVLAESDQMPGSGFAVADGVIGSSIFDCDVRSELVAPSSRFQIPSLKPQARLSTQDTVLDGLGGVAGADLGVGEVVVNAGLGAE